MKYSKDVDVIMYQEELMNPEQFKIVREFLEYSLNDLAELLQRKDKSCVSHIENGRTAINVPLDFMMKTLAKEKKKEKDLSVTGPYHAEDYPQNIIDFTRMNDDVY